MKIVVIGESCTDYFIYGDVKRVSPEAPVPVLDFVRTETNGGMAENVVKNIQYCLEDNNINLKEVDIELITQENAIYKTRFVEEKSNYQFLRFDYEEEIKPLRLNVKHQQLIKEADFVVVSDYNKGFLTDRCLLKIAKLCKTSILDTKRKISKKVAQAFGFVKMNENEYQNNFHLHNVDFNKIITLGSKGAVYKDLLFSTNSKEQIDVSGAGDTFTSAFIVMYFTMVNINEAMIYANTMAGKVVSKRGVCTP
jgi:bifunctional ADP-heptose synthase (sugar kinase/adenylyltransferase)